MPHGWCAMVNAVTTVPLIPLENEAAVPLRHPPDPTPQRCAYVSPFARLGFGLHCTLPLLPT
jgi:hypothetical protein